MKVAIIIILFFVAIFILIQVYISFSTSNTENQPYTVVQTVKNIEIRHYPSVNIATIRTTATTYKDLGNGGFRKLANYIFGGNERKEQIPMTAPVQMVIDDTSSSMSFVMPSVYQHKDLPKPNSKAIELSTTQDEYVAAIRFGGFSSDKKIEAYIDLLKTTLQTLHINCHGSFKYLGYNPPYQLFGRRNEVIVKIDWQKP